MVQIPLPPPQRTPRPVFHTLTAGATILRLFRPGSYHALATTFRFHGPLARFDHHRVEGEQHRQAHDSIRGIYYAAFRLSSCVVEIFGDIGVIECDDWLLAVVTVAQDLRLLDLRGHGAMRAGTVAAIAKDPERPRTQAWSRYFYEHPEIYSLVDGLCYSNAHNDEGALALYERAAPALQCPADAVRRLDSAELRPTLLEIADRHDLILA